ncbi:MAG: hypothetical protein ACP5QU_01560 [Anaerolineae bacterium]
MKMETRFTKSVTDKRKIQKADAHIPPLALFLFIALLAGTVKGILLLESIGATDLQIATFTFPMLFLSTPLMCCLP